MQARLLKMKTVVVQINGKVRAKMTVPADMSEDDVKAKALADENVARYLEDKPCARQFIPGKLLSLVVN